MRIRDICYYNKLIGPRNQLIVKVETDNGFYGIGESGFSGRELAVCGALDHLKEFVIGKDPRAIGAIWQEMYRGAYFEGGRTISAAISALDIALYDILGKYLNTPVYQLLGGKQRDYIPCFATTSAQGAKKLITEVEALLADGWSVIRISPQCEESKKGYFDMTMLEFDPFMCVVETASAIRSVRDALGYHFQLGIDLHHRLSPSELLSFCNRLYPGDLDFIEEPLRAQNPNVYKSLQDRISIPLAIGEEISNKWDYLPYLSEGLTQFIRQDICNIGGFTEAMKVAAVAETYYIDQMPHNPLGAICTAATVHFAAAVPLFHSMEYRSMSKDMEGLYGSGYFRGELYAEKGAITVPERPGLGIELEIDAIEKSEDFHMWEPKHLHKPDGSYTNW